MFHPLYISAGFGIKPHTQTPSETEIQTQFSPFSIFRDFSQSWRVVITVRCEETSSVTHAYMSMNNMCWSHFLWVASLVWFASYFVAEVRPPICYSLSYLEERETDLSGIWCTDDSWLGWLDLSFRLISMTYRFSFVKMWFWTNNLD